MFLNVGGAVLGVAVLTVISDSVGNNGNNALEGYRAGYYAAIAMAAIGLVISLFFAPSKREMEATVKAEAESQDVTPSESPHNNPVEPSKEKA